MSTASDQAWRNRLLDSLRLRARPWRGRTTRKHERHWILDQLLARYPEIREETEKLFREVTTPLRPGDPRRHHFVPQFLLKQFAAKDRLHRVSFDKSQTPTIVHVRDAAVIKDMYTIVLAGIGESAAAERTFATMDADAATPLHRLAVSHEFPPTYEARVTLAAWILLLHHRSPRERLAQQANDNVAAREAMEYWLAEADVSDKERWLKHLEDYDFTLHQVHHMFRTLTSLNPRTYNTMARMSWTLLSFTDQGIVLPDSPVLMDPALVEGDQESLENREILVPISRHTALRIHDDPATDETIVCDPENHTAERVNRSLIARATREFYCHPDDATILPSFDDLLQEKQREFAANADSFKIRRFERPDDWTTWI